MKWYVLQVKNGSEEEIRDKLIDLGYQALAPSENRLIRSKKTWNKKKYIIFTQYVFVCADFDAENYYKISNLDGVYKILGGGRSPSPLSFLEVEWIRLLGNNNEPLEPTMVEVAGDEVKIVKGILLNFKSRIKSYDLRSKKATFEISICNETREITLSIDYQSVEDEESEQDTSEG